MTSLGDTLRRARLKRNLELNRIADELKISASMLKAIEDERFDKLPGGVFVRSFVRQYARLLELDEEEMVSELRRVLEPEADPPPAVSVTPTADADIPLPRVQGWEAVKDRGMRWSSSLVALGLLVVVMLACAAAYAWWQRGRRPVSAHRETTAPAQTAPASQPAAPTPAPPEPVAQAAPPQAIPLSPVAEEAPAAATPAPANPDAAPAPLSAPAAQSAAPPADANPDAAVRVEVTAEESVWISARADGQFSFSGVLEANQSRTVAANKNVWLKVGNAGGVTVSLNGKPIGPLGDKGVVRTLQLTSGGFKILPPDVPKPAPPTDLPTASPKPL